jgi:hypothetical protein
LGRKFDRPYRDTLKAAIGSLSPSEVAAIPEGVSPSALGATAADLVYTPVAPCRIIDTRLGGGPIVPGVNRNFIAAGLCGVPFGPATAVMINFVAVGPAGSGDLRVFPFPSAAPLASIVNYAAVGLNIANGIAVPICNPAVSACSSDITVQADASATHLVADVQGYFAAPSPIPTLWAVVNSDGTLARGFHAASATHLATGTYQVTFDRDVTACAYTATIGLSGTSGSSSPGEITVVGRAGIPNALFIQTFDSAGALSDRGFHVHTNC